jgi:hypothetical protein
MPRLPTFTIALENVSTAPATLYLTLLTTTFYHFSPHHRSLSAFVKRKHAEFSKKCAFSLFQKCQISPTTYCGFAGRNALPFVA